MIYFFCIGLINQRVPLAALIAPALSRDSIKLLTQGTTYINKNIMNEEDEIEDNVIVPDKLSGPLLAKVDIKFFSFVKK